MLRACLLTLIALIPAAAQAEELRFDAKKLYEMGACVGLQLSADGASLELERGVLSEGDGPAAGYTYKPNEEKLSATTWIKKELDVNGPARKATLLVAPGGKLDAILNGKPLTLPAPEKIGSYWQGYDIPPELLVSGKNEIILHGQGKMWIARDEDFALGSKTRTKHPNMSAKSSDGGKTWSRDKLGVRDDMDGEYYVRLALDQPVAQGMVFLPLLDTAEGAPGQLAAPVKQVGRITIRVVADDDKNAGVGIAARTAATPDLARLEIGEKGKAASVEQRDLVLDEPKGRYLQLRVAISGKDPARPVRVKEIVVRTEHQRAEDWSRAVKVQSVQNAQHAAGPFAIAHERPDHPKLKELRARFKLDEVVKGAKDDVELMGKLAGWVSRQFSKMHLRDAYPAWDALEILKPHADGTPVGGFCQQYNIVLLQACQSFGLLGRAVSIGPGDHGDKIRSGHEVVEIWSNDHRKWVYMDGQKAWHMVDDATGSPLSLLELHERQMAVLAGKNAPAVRAVKWSEAAPEWGGLESFPPFIELRLIPRSDFLSETAPLPLNQGMRGWFWTGHHVWAGGVPQRSSLLYGQFVRQARHWNAPANQVQLMLEPMVTPGEIRVHLVAGPTTPFDSYDVRIDGGERRRLKDTSIVWKLHPGVNRLEATPCSVQGRDGVASWVSLDFGK